MFLMVYRKWGKGLDDMVTDLKTNLTHEVDKYLTGTLQSWILLDVSVIYNYAEIFIG